jgi:hypothetical protein
MRSCSISKLVLNGFSSNQIDLSWSCNYLILDWFWLNRGFQKWCDPFWVGHHIDIHPGTSISPIAKCQHFFQWWKFFNRQIEQVKIPIVEEIKWPKKFNCRKWAIEIFLSPKSTDLKFSIIQSTMVQFPQLIQWPNLGWFLITIGFWWPDVISVIIGFKVTNQREYQSS